MKSMKFFFFAVILSGILCGCKDEYDPAGSLHPSLTGKYLQVSQSTFNHISPSAFKDNFNVVCSGAAWRFSNMPAWLMVSPSAGDSSAAVVLEGSENTSADTRTSIFYLESSDASWKFSKSMSVSQGGLETSLTTEPSSLSLSGKGETAKVLVIANCAWTAKCAQDWISLDVPESNELAVTAAVNPSDSYREATIYISYGETQSVAISVTQFPAEISASDAILKYGNNASKYDISVTSDIDWTAVASESWIMINPTSGGVGMTEVSIEVAPNTTVDDRKGFVSFKTGEYDRFQIQIEQEGLFIKATEELAFRSMENSQSLEIQSNTDWEILSAPEWLGFSETRGTGTAELTVTASENSALEARTGIIEIGQSGLTLSCEVKVTQSGRTLSPDTSLLEFSDKESELTFELISDGSWTSSCSDTWFTANPVSGNGDATVTVRVEENTDSETRSGSITYSFGSQSKEVIVQQAGKYFNIDGDSFEFNSHGGTHTISLSTNEPWTAQTTENADWLSLSSSSGEGDTEIVLTVADNPSVNSRSAEVVITPLHSQAIRIPVKQNARYLKVSAESLMFFSDGGKSDIITIDTDGQYEISQDGTWFTVNEDDAGFSVTVDPFKQPDTRTGKIIISLTDLKEGALSLELSVTQIGEGFSFIIDGYPSDGDWNDFGNSTLTFSISGYTSDQNWNTQYESKIVINISGYKEDEDWNSK